MHTCVTRPHEALTPVCGASPWERPEGLLRMVAYTPNANAPQTLHSKMVTKRINSFDSDSQYNFPVEPLKNISPNKHHVHLPLKRYLFIYLFIYQRLIL